MDSIGQFSDYVEKMDYAHLPRAVIENTKKLIIDSIGVAMAGLNAPGCPEVLDLVKHWGGCPEATVLMSDFRCPAPWAGFVNSIFMHALDFDDTLDESAHHATVSALPAALAMAESKKEVTGKDLICAVAVGQDISCRLAIALRRPLAWTRAATCGFFGATASASKILRLDQEKTWNAFGIAYSQTSGNIQGLLDGALSKRMQPAFAVKSAILSAALAERGLSGARNVLEGDFGFFKLYEGNDYDKNVLLKDLGNDFTGNRLSLKPYPSCRMTHSSIDLALKLRNEYDIELDTIEDITVTCSKMVYEMVGKPFEIRKNAQTDAQFSIPYTVIIALLKGDVFLSDFEENNIRNQRIIDLAKLVKVIPDEGIEARNMMECSLEIKTRDGQVFSSSTSAAKGNPLNPMDIDDCMEKFKKCIAYSRKEIPQDTVTEILNILVYLEDLNDIKALMDLLC